MNKLPKSNSMLMPMRVVSAWAFMQMRTWGLHFMKISGWLYLSPVFVLPYLYTVDKSRWCR